MSDTASDPHSPQTGVSVGTGSTVNSRAPRPREPRTIPPWIDSYEVRYGEPTEAAIRSLYRPPPPAATPQHNNTPSELRRRVSRDGYIYPGDQALTEAKRSRLTLQNMLRKGGAERGRKWDHLRSAEPVVVSKFLMSETGSPWRNFVRSSAYGHLSNEEAQIVGVDELDKMQPGFNNPVDIPRSGDLKRSRAKRTAALYKRLWNGMLKHPLVPLALRLTVLITSVIALALGIKILESVEGHASQGAEWTQAVVAIVVDCVAIPYIGYMTWDEYTGKPLGLRTATSKISLVLMDLFFIIFKSASTTLAFEALVYHNSPLTVVERYSRALAAFQTTGLISWTMTFTVNVFRLVQRLGGSEEDMHMWGGHGGHGGHG
ncbi:hypothetical protein CONLIGDRAFT_376365 [Coniochaeta ligniaria NRRL 30616]|uniref:Regulator of phospholipase D SRF1 n=1 Tax=Coniochaeta ligniaria NRRL 30616 TaxID=1408157 RepID=A0A1J7JFE3_9PEZI|nr:hypothetical protein CONLIGDRAFT_376365 [Coniochaeta ligniaria NRRL 30616]